MRKLLVMFLIIGTILPSFSFVPSVEAGVSPEGIRKRRRPRCRTQGKVVICRMPRVKRPKRCGVMPCIPDGYYRPNPRKRIPLYPMPNG